MRAVTTVLADPLLQPLFGAGQPEHVDHLTAFTVESFGGPDRFSRAQKLPHRQRRRGGLIRNG
jgi:hemoglobin